MLSHVDFPVGEFLDGMDGRIDMNEYNESRIQQERGETI